MLRTIDNGGEKGFNARPVKRLMVCRDTPRYVFRDMLPQRLWNTTMTSVPGRCYIELKVWMWF